MASFDVVYPLGDGSRLNNIEIRFSLRSLEKHAWNVGTIYVIGEKPKLNWNLRLVHIPFEETENRYANVWQKAVLAAVDNRITERFLWMNDDFYLLEDFDAGRVPYFHRGARMDRMRSMSLDFEDISTAYQKTLRRTYDALKRRNLSTYHFGTHQPINFEKTKIIELFNEFECDIYPRYGLSLRICYGNYFNVERVRRVTALIKRNEMPKAGGRFNLSSHNSATKAQLRRELTKFYPEPSEFERI